MRAKYLGNGHGDWKGVNLTPFCEFDVPDRLEGMVTRNPNFEVLGGKAADQTEDTPTPAKRKPGRPRKSE